MLLNRAGHFAGHLARHFAGRVFRHDCARSTAVRAWAGFVSALCVMVMGVAQTQAATPRGASNTEWDQFTQAARADDVTVIGRLPKMRLDFKSRDELGNTVLMVAVREGAENLALALLAQPEWQAMELIDTENNLGENALMLAAIKNSLRTAARLIELNAETARTGWTALHYAATGGHEAMIRLLFDANAYIDAPSPNGTTPLMMAARFNHRLAASTLLELGADPTQRNEAGLTARDYARERGNTALEFWLEMEEVSFTNRYLVNKPKVDPDIFKPKEEAVEIFKGIR